MSLPFKASFTALVTVSYIKAWIYEYLSKYYCIKFDFIIARSMEMRDQAQEKKS